MWPSCLGTRPLPVTHAGLAQHPISQCSQAAFPECLAEPQQGQPLLAASLKPLPPSKHRETSLESSELEGPLLWGGEGGNGIFSACQPSTKKLLLNWKMCRGEKQEIYKATNG